jgi:hypothetical protein
VEKAEAAMKKLLIVFMLGAMVSSAFPAELRILGGMTFTKSSEPLGGGWIPEVIPQATSVTGMTFGVGIVFTLEQSIALELDGLFMQKGTTIETRWMDGTLIGRDALRVNELSFPVLFRIAPWPETGPYLLGGGELAIVLTRKPREIDHGFVFGLGFRKQIRTMAVSIEGRYHLGGRDLMTDESPLRKMRSFAVLVGFSF